MHNPFLENMKHFMANQNFSSQASDLITRNTEMLSSVAQVVSKNTQNLMNKNVKMMQESTSSTFDMLKAMSNNNSSEQLMHRAQDSARDAFDHVSSNSKDFFESVTKTSMEVFDILTKAASENMHECMSQLSKGQQFQHAGAEKKKPA